MASSFGMLRCVTSRAGANCSTKTPDNAIESAPEGAATRACSRTAAGSGAAFPPRQKAQELPPRHRLAAEAAQMRRGQLAVDELDGLREAVIEQAGQRSLGCVGLAAEHRLPEEHPPELHAVEPAHQSAATPGFIAVREAALVQARIGRLHLG